MGLAVSSMAGPYWPAMASKGRALALLLMELLSGRHVARVRTRMNPHECAITDPHYPTISHLIISAFSRTLVGPYRILE